MHGVAPHMCDQVVRPLLDQGAGGRSPGFLLRAKQTLARSWVKLDHPKCPPAGIRDPDTADRNRLAGLALCSCKPGADEVGKHWARKAVDVHDCFGGTERIAGKQSECSALFAAEMTFSRGCR